METTLKTKINLRKDVLSAWTKADPVLGDGEMAIVEDESGQLAMKIGNGLSSFSQLPFIYQQEFKTEKLTTKEATFKSISQGYSVSSTPTSLATGVFSEAKSSFGVAHGIEAQVLSSDDYAFVYSGVNQESITDRYTSHGAGTFSVNPAGGLSGFYVGEKNLQDVLNSSTTRTWIKNPSDPYLSSGQYSDLSVIKLSKNEYEKLIIDGTINESCLYDVSSDYTDAYGAQIKNVSMEGSTYVGEAATRPYVDDMILTEKSERETSELSINDRLDGVSADIKNTIEARLMNSGVAIGEGAEQISSSYAFGSGAFASVNSTAIGCDAYASGDGNGQIRLGFSASPSETYFGAKTNDDGASAVSLQTYLDQAKSYRLVDAVLSRVDSSLCCQIEDRAITTVGISSEATPVVIVLPSKPAYGARDFILRIEISSSTAPSFTFQGLDESLSFDAESDDWAMMEPGLNIVSFTETK